MSKMILILSLLFGLSVRADSGFDQLKKLFHGGQLLPHQEIKTVEEGVYIGRCFDYRSEKPFGTYIGFQNLTQDSGPIAVDPVLMVGFKTVNQSNFYDQIPVPQLLSNFVLYKSELEDDKIIYNMNMVDWSFQIRKSGQYIVQRNISPGIPDSYCYYYKFRSKFSSNGSDHAN